jgi:hypothetical protein
MDFGRTIEGRWIMSADKLTGKILVFVSTLCLSTQAIARDMMFESHAKAGTPARIRTFFDCRRHSPGGTGGGMAEHGTVVAKFTSENRCGSANEPVNQIWYTSSPGFKGVDTVTIPVASSLNVIIKVTVD